MQVLWEWPAEEAVGRSLTWQSVSYHRWGPVRDRVKTVPLIASLSNCPLCIPQSPRASSNQERGRRFMADVIAECMRLMREGERATVHVCTWSDLDGPLHKAGCHDQRLPCN